METTRSTRTHRWLRTTFEMASSADLERVRMGVRHRPEYQRRSNGEAGRAGPVPPFFVGSTTPQVGDPTKNVWWARPTWVDHGIALYLAGLVALTAVWFVWALTAPVSGVARVFELLLAGVATTFLGVRPGRRAVHLRTHRTRH